MARLVQTAPPAATPVSIADIRAHCRVDDTDSDLALTALLAAATDHLDGPHGLLGKCIVSQTWRQEFATFECLRLAVGPVASISSITYYDADNAEQTLSASVYALRFDEIGAHVDLQADQVWPATYAREDAVKISFVAGVAAADVPAALKAAVMMLVSHWNEDREGSADIPQSVKRLVGMRREVFL